MKGVRRPLIPFNINFGSRVAKLVDPSKEAWRSMRTCQQYLDGPDTSLYPAPKRRQELQLVRSAHQILHVDHARVSDYGARHKTRLAQMGASDAGLCLRLGGLREDKAAEEVDVIELGAVDWVAGLAEGTGSTPGKGEENRIAWGGDGDVCADTFNNAGTFMPLNTRIARPKVPHLHIPKTAHPSNKPHAPPLSPPARQHSAL